MDKGEDYRAAPGDAVSATRAGPRGRWRRPGNPGRRRRRPAARAHSTAASSPGWRAGRAAPGGAAFGQFGVAHLEGQGPGRDVQGDPVAAPDQGQRAAGRGLRGGVQDDRPVGGAGHPPVADPHHVADAAQQQLPGQGHIGHFRHARVAARAAVPDDQHGVLVDIQVGVVRHRVVVRGGVEDQGPAPVLEQVRGGCGLLDDRPVRGEVAAQHRGPGPGGLERLGHGLDDVMVPALGAGHVGANPAPVTVIASAFSRPAAASSRITAGSPPA